MLNLKHLLVATASLAGLSRAAQLQPVSNFGDNPSGVRMYIYVPDNLGTNPAVIVASHYCTGTAQAYYGGTQYAQLSEQHNFIVIYPESPYQGGCWDVSSDASLTRDGGGDSQGIASMVRYVIDTYQADASRVFAVGTSSGAMMTNVLAATYPDIFEAASVYAGVPAGCFYTGTVNGWNSQCANGQVIRSQDEWADEVRDMYPGGYGGEYPRMLIYHGTNDETLNGQNYDETIKQWSGIFGYSGQPQETVGNDPAAPFTKEVYGERLVGYSGNGISHNIPMFPMEDLEWFGLL